MAGYERQLVPQFISADKAGDEVGGGAAEGRTDGLADIVAGYELALDGAVGIGISGAQPQIAAEPQVGLGADPFDRYRKAGDVYRQIGNGISDGLQLLVLIFHRRKQTIGPFRIPADDEAVAAALPETGRRIGLQADNRDRAKAEIKQAPTLADEG